MTKLTAAQEIAALKLLITELVQRVSELEKKSFWADWNSKLNRAVKKEKD